ncbi:MFS transporter [Streptomyces sp. NBC_00539]|uniref:MFS transporter n=1 Tax=Streptomyces sp. NBC_00539 TaxID=2975770 RepID=UPI002E809D22|nr:MFS transporter [Streptomyces sp. NBC_00539]WUC63323.1 MFS transporter [Streptomyces sp. NBC_00539]
MNPPVPPAPPPRRLLPLFTLVAVSGVSSLGIAMTLIAVPWFVLHGTGSGARTGLVAAAEMLGLLCSAVLAGPVVDRLPARAVSTGADVLSAAALALVPLLHSRDTLPLPVLVCLVFVVGAARGPADTAKQLLLTGAMEGAGVTAERATSAVEGARRIGMMTGAPLAGLLIATAGPVRTLCADVAAMLFCALLVALMVPAAGATRTTGPGVTSYVRDLRTGWTRLRDDRLLRAMTTVLLVTNALDGALNGVLYPAYGTRVLHSSSLFGAMVTAIGAGALLGAALFGWTGHRAPRRALFVAAFVLVGAVRCAALAAEPAPVVLLALLALSGIGSGVVGPLMMSVAYQRVPQEVRGRVFGLLVACALAATPLGMLGAGVLLDRWGLTWSLVATGAVYLGVTLAPLVLRVWRQLDIPDPAMPQWDQAGGRAEGAVQVPVPASSH